MIDERFFSRPTEFLPERWTTSPELVLNSEVFIPFLSGMDFLASASVKATNKERPIFMYRQTSRIDGTSVCGSIRGASV